MGQDKTMLPIDGRPMINPDFPSSA
ncbi:MAG: hypothetical protein ACYTEK_03195 [Planctomycetota bacterium]